MQPQTLQAYEKLLRALESDRDELERRIAHVEAAIADEKSDAERKRIEELEAALAALPGGGRSGRRRKGEFSLKRAVIEVTSGAPKTKNEIIEAVLTIGYRFSTKTPVTSLNQLLYTSKDPRFENHGGRYGPVVTVRSTGAPPPRRTSAEAD